MSVIGLDLGNQSCFVAVARGGGIETVANEYSDRSTPSIVSLGPKQRFIGSAAKQQVVTNFRNTATNFRNLLGLKFKDPAVQHELQYSSVSCVETSDGGVGVQMDYLGEPSVFKPEQVVAMLLTQLKKVGEMNLGSKVTDCVISVPCFFDDSQRRAMLDAASTAGLNCLRLMNDTTATALAYGIYKQDLPAPEEKPRHVVFVDMGNSALRATACSFNKGKLKVLATAWDAQLGGRDFDRRIQKHFTEVFKDKYKVDASSKPRPRIRLSQESEKLKKLMSANTTEIPMNIECFMEDKDVSGRMKRADFEELCADLIARLEVPLKKVLADSGLSAKDIYAVEVVGGSTRVPCVREAVKRVLGHEPSTTMNQDEAVARGCALQCAMLSPTFKVREFKVEDCINFPIRLTWKPSITDEEALMDVFPARHAYPQSKMLSFFRREPFFLQARYTDARPNAEIGTFTIGKVVPTAEGEASKVKVKVRVNIHGIFSVSSATLVEKLTKEEEAAEASAEAAAAAPSAAAPAEGQENSEQPMDTDGAAPADNGDAAPAAAPANGSEPAADAPPAEGDPAKKTDEPPKKKVKVRSHDLPIDAVIDGRCGPDAITRLIERENDMISQDRLEKERADAKNAVEEYVYEMREKISDALSDFISEAHREQFSSQLTATEDWLYEDGEDVSRQVYVDKLGELQKTGDPVKMRAREFEERQPAFDTLGRTIVHYRKILSRYAEKDEKYVHLSEDDMKSVSGHVEARQKWMHERMAEAAKISKFDNPPFLASAINTERMSLENLCNPIVNKPKPKVEPPKETKPAEPATEQPAAADATQQPPPAANGQEQPEAPMDCDLD